jgi:hypothetical protein
MVVTVAIENGVRKSSNQAKSDVVETARCAERWSRSNRGFQFLDRVEEPFASLRGIPRGAVKKIDISSWSMPDRPHAGVWRAALTRRRRSDQ